MSRKKLQVEPLSFEFPHVGKLGSLSVPLLAFFFFPPGDCSHDYVEIIHTRPHIYILNFEIPKHYFTHICMYLWHQICIGVRCLWQSLKFYNGLLTARSRAWDPVGLINMPIFFFFSIVRIIPPIALTRPSTGPILGLEPNTGAVSQRPRFSFSNLQIDLFSGRHFFYHCWCLRIGDTFI